MTLKVKSGSKDLTGRLLAMLRKGRPQTATNGTYDVGRSTVESPSKVRYVVKTGIRPFDDRVGGMPIGKTVELMGVPSSGKSAMAIRTCARAQAGFVYERISDGKGGYTLEQLKPGTFNVTVLYYDNEGSLSDPERRVVDGHELDCIIEQCDTVDLLFKTMERVMDAVVEEEEETGILQIMVVVLDTIASTCSLEDFKREWGKRDFPRAPAEYKHAFSVLIRQIQRENVLLIGVNHVTKKMERTNGRVAFKAWEHSSPGGKAFSYYSTHQVFFDQVLSNYRLGDGGSPDGFLLSFFTTKNRLGSPLRGGRLVLLFGQRDQEGKVLLEGGLHGGFSLLETLINSKAAEVSKQTKAIIFKFKKFGVTTTTFKASHTLEEQDDAAPPGPVRKRKKALDEDDEPVVIKPAREPRIANRAAWLTFYTEHAADLDALYLEANRRNQESSAFRSDFASSEDADTEDEVDADDIDT